MTDADARAALESAGFRIDAVTDGLIHASRGDARAVAVRAHRQPIRGRMVAFWRFRVWGDGRVRIGTSTPERAAEALAREAREDTQPEMERIPA